MGFNPNTQFITYENRRNPHITIHKVGCTQIEKNGGTGEGEYKKFELLKDAEIYAESTNLEIKHCFFCNPK